MVGVGWGLGERDQVFIDSLWVQALKGCSAFDFVGLMRLPSSAAPVQNDEWDHPKVGHALLGFRQDYDGRISELTHHIVARPCLFGTVT